MLLLVSGSGSSSRSRRVAAATRSRVSFTDGRSPTSSGSSSFRFASEPKTRLPLSNTTRAKHGDIDGERTVEVRSQTEIRETTPSAIANIETVDLSPLPAGAPVALDV